MSLQASMPHVPLQPGESAAIARRRMRRDACIAILGLHQIAPAILVDVFGLSPSQVEAIIAEADARAASREA